MCCKLSWPLLLGVMFPLHPPTDCLPTFLAPPQLEWGRGRVFDAEVGAMFQRLVAEAKQVGGRDCGRLAD